MPAIARTATSVFDARKPEHGHQRRFGAHHFFDDFPPPGMRVDHVRHAILRAAKADVAGKTTLMEHDPEFSGVTVTVALGPANGEPLIAATLSQLPAFTAKLPLKLVSVIANCCALEEPTSVKARLPGLTFRIGDGEGLGWGLGFEPDEDPADPPP